MKTLLVALFLLMSVNLTLCDTKKCLKLDVYITQKVENNGFHRYIQWLIEMTSPDKETWLESNCNMTLQLVVTPGMYVNPDQINDLNRVGALSALIDGTVDVEQPNHDATEHTVYIFLPNDNVERISISLPIHLRYQRSQIGGGYGKVLLRKPSLLVHCKDSFKRTCGKGLKVEAPCTVDWNDNCIWKNVSYKSLIDEVELFVPVGDLDDYPIVSIVTLLLGCAGCIYILSILSTKSF